MMHKRKYTVFAVMMLATLIAIVGCAAPTPQVIEKPVTIVVEKEVPVEKEVVKTVVVEKQVPVEKKVVEKVEVTVESTVIVEKTVVVSPTQPPSKFKEAPSLAERVQRGELPPVEERLPINPMVVEPVESVGQYGGSWTMLMGKASDTKLAHAYGYTRLVGWNRDLDKFVPDLCESYEVNENREFTFFLRKGLKWSDGQPFTADDFRFYWEDIANNEELNPEGIPSALLVGDEAPQVTFPDAYTIKYSWSQPNHTFLANMASGMALEIFACKHYLRDFHPKYGDEAEIQKMVEDEGYENWTALFNAMWRSYRMDNPDLPTIQPWIPTARPPQERYAFVRNPYYHKVDTEGNQLPYLDNLIMLAADRDLIAMKCTAGDADFQSRQLGFDDITLLKENEAQGGYETYLWKTATDSMMLIYPNLTCQDEVLRELMRDRRFRIALSHAIDRQEINEVLFLGYGIPQQAEILPGLPGYNKEWAQAHTAFDLDKANELLDEIGLEWDDNHEYRLLPDGRTLEIVLEDAGEHPVYPDMIELITATWKDIGVKLLYKYTERATFRQRVVAGEAAMSVYLSQGGRTFFWGPEPDRKVPMSGGSACLWGTAFGLWKQTDGQEGQEPPPEVKTLQELADAWLVEPDDARRQEIFNEIRQIFAEERFEIGTVGGLPQPVVVKTNFHNVPREGYHAWDTGGYLGWVQVGQLWTE
jgi:peptide/nickel transport system substrate-binding protein